MKKTSAIATAVLFVATASWAATEVLLPDTQTVIDIPVAASELAECRQTLRDVAQRPAVTDNGSPIFFSFSQDLPSVRCVVSEDA
jgi:hypothetical protein